MASKEGRDHRTNSNLITRSRTYGWMRLEFPLLTGVSTIMLDSAETPCFMGDPLTTAVAAGAGTVSASAAEVATGAASMGSAVEAILVNPVRLAGVNAVAEPMEAKPTITVENFILDNTLKYQQARVKQNVCTADFFCNVGVQFVERIFCIRQ